MISGVFPGIKAEFYSFLGNYVDTLSLLAAGSQMSLAFANLPYSHLRDSQWDEDVL